ncbi:MAG: hypothetical protein ABEI52_05505 [Halobacteriaceae archaeon]
MSASQRMWINVALGGFSLGVAVTGALFAEQWPWWLSLIQGVIAVAFFYVALEHDPRLTNSALP